MIKLLAKKEALLDQQDQEGQTVLMHCLRYEDVDAVETLIDRGANINIKNKDGNNVLTLAKKVKSTEIAHILAQQI